MNLKKLLSFVLVFLLLGIATQAQTPPNFYVNNVTGNDANPGTTALPKKTVTSALIAAASGSTIHVAATGVNYTEATPGMVIGTPGITGTYTFTVWGAGTPVFTSDLQIGTAGTAGDVTFTGTFNFNGLTLTNGVLKNANNVTMAAGATVTRTENGSITSGQLAFAGAADYNYINAGTAAGTTITVGLEYSNTAARNVTTTATGGDITWRLDQNRSLNGILTLGAGANNGGANLNAFTLTLTGANAHITDGDITNGTLSFALTGAASIDGVVVGYDLPNVTATSSTALAALTINPATGITHVDDITASGTASINANNTGDIDNVTLNGSGNIVTTNDGLAVGNVLAASGSTGNITINNAVLGANTVASITQTGIGIITYGGNVNAINVTGNVLLNTAIALPSAPGGAKIGQALITFTDWPVIIGGSVTNNASFSNTTNVAGNTNLSVILFAGTGNTVNVTGALTNSVSGSVATTGGGTVTASGDIQFAATGGNLDLANVTNSATLTGATNTNGRIIATGGGVATVDADDVLNSSTYAGAMIDFSLLSGVNTLNSIVSSGTGTGGDILFGNGNLVCPTITNSRGAAGADINLGTGAGGAGTVTSNTVTNSGSSDINFILTVGGAVGAALSPIDITQSGSGTIDFPNSAGAVFTFDNVNLSAGRLDFGDGTGAIGVGGNSTLSNGTLDLGVAARSLNFTAAIIQLGGTGTKVTFANSNLAVIDFQQPVPNVNQQILIGTLDMTFPGSVTVTNAATLPAPYVYFQSTDGGSGNPGNLIITNLGAAPDALTFNASGLGVYNTVSLDNVRFYIGTNDPGGTAGGNFQNTTGYVSTNAGFVMMSGNAAQAVNATAAVADPSVRFGGFGVDNNAAGAPDVTFTNPCVFAAEFYMAEGTISNVNVSFNGTNPFPTIFRTEGTFVAAPTFISKVNVTYFGFDKATSVEVPGAGFLNDLTIQTTNGAEAGKGIVTLTGATQVDGTLTIFPDQSLYTGANNLVIAGATAIVNGNLVDDGALRVQLANPTGTVFTGSGSVPSLQINAGSVGNALNGIAGLVSQGFGTDGVWGGAGAAADALTTYDGNITYAGGAASSLTISFDPSVAAADFNNLTTAAGATLTLGSNALMSGNMNHVAGAIDLGGFTLDHRGTAPGITVGATTTNGLLYFRTAATNLTVTGPGTAVIGANFQFEDASNNALTQTFTFLSASTGDLQIDGDITLSRVTNAEGALFDIGAGRTLTAGGANVTVGTGSGFTAVNGGTTGMLTLDVTGPTNTVLNYNTPSNTNVTNLTIADNVALSSGGTLTTVTTFNHTGGELNFGGTNLQVGNGTAATFNRSGATATYVGTGYLIWNSTTVAGFQHSSIAAAGPMTINNFRVSDALTLQNARDFNVVMNLHLNNDVITNQVAAAGPGYVHVGDATNVPMIRVTGGAGDVLVNALQFDNANADYLFDGAAFTVSTRVWPTTATLARDVTVNMAAAGNRATLGANRQINRTTTLMQGILSWDSPFILTIADDQLIYRYANGSLDKNSSGGGAIGTLTANSVNLQYRNVVGNTGIEYSDPGTVNNVTLDATVPATSVDIASSRTIAGTITWNSIINFNTATTTDVTQAQTLPAGSTVNVNGTGTVNWNGGFTNNGTYTNNGTTSSTGGFGGSGTLTNNGVMNLDGLAMTGATTLGAASVINLTGDGSLGNLVVPAAAIPAALTATISTANDLTLNGTLTTLPLGGNPLLDLTFVGNNAQAVALGANRALNNITLAKGADETVTFSGGNATLNAATVGGNAAGLLTLTRGILVIGNIAAGNPALLTIQATVAGGIITNTGYLRNPAQAADKAHVSGRLGVFVPAATIGRTEWPVGSGAANGDYRPAAITFTAGNATIAPTTIIVNHQDGEPTGDKNLPVSGGVKSLDPTQELLIGNKAPYNWIFESTTSLGASQVFDVELQGSNINKPLETHNDLRIIRRFDGDITVNGWNVEGALDTYSNILVANNPNPGDTILVVRNRGSLGSSVAQKAIFTIGIPSDAVTYTVDGVVAYDNAANDPFVGATVQLWENGAVAYTATSGAGGAFNFANVPNGDYVLTAMYNGAWSEQNASDALGIAAHFAGTTLLTGTSLGAADVNASTTVNNTDALLVVRRFAGLVNSFAAGDWYFEQLPVMVDAANVTQNLLGAAYGDVNKSGTATALPKLVAENFVEGDVIQTAPTKEFDLPISVTEERQIGALSLAFKYPSDLVELTGIKGAKEGIVYNDVDGQVRVAWADVTGGKNAVQLAKDAALLVLSFKPTENFKVGATFSLEVDGVNEIVDAKGNVLSKSGLKAASVESFIPKEFALEQNYPNPFNPSTVIEYALPADAKVTLTIYNVLGQEVARLIDTEQEAGIYKFDWNASGLATGVYIYNMQIETANKNFSDTKRMMLLK